MNVSVKNKFKRSVNIILKQKILVLTKELTKISIIIFASFILIMLIMCIKYKPAYEVIVSGEKIGYVNNVVNFKNLIDNEILNKREKNMVDISLIEEPKYCFKLLQRTKDYNENDIIKKIKTSNISITYRFYNVSLNNEITSTVSTLEEAEQIVNDIKSEFDDNLEIQLQINEIFTQDLDEIKTDSIEVATNNMEIIANEIKEENSALSIINGVKLSILPVQGKISSRYGASSSIRKSLHTGLDIACSSGTEINVVASGTVIFAEYCGSYGNLVKIDHGNGVETWYAHASKICTKVGDKVNSGDVIALVGSTGNSTGPHLHFEIRINGNSVNPQNYLY